MSLVLVKIILKRVCQMSESAQVMKRIVENVEKVIVGKVDVDSNPGISSKYGIRNIPTVLFFKNGQVADKQVGAVPKGNLVNKVEALL
jgi:thioredoxin 1